MNNLDAITDSIRAEFDARNAARDAALNESRALIRACANTIRAVHREEWDTARAGLEGVRAAADQMVGGARPYADIYYSGYVQDALKEYVEAFVIHALVRGDPLPTPANLNVPGSTYLNGLAEAASELRRKCLDIIREDHSDEAERLLDHMDVIYHALMGFDFPDAITGGLRRRVDNLRGVLERTRGDLTNSLRQQRLRSALVRLEERLGLAGLGGELETLESEPEGGNEESNDR